MSNNLNITNGDSAVAIMKQANIPGVFLPWRDVLHEGPVPDKLSLEELSKVRAQFIIERGWGKPEHITDSFTQRDNQLKASSTYEKITLWFEHDLYDQLQILQILDWLYTSSSREVNLTIICTEHYLGMLTPEEMVELTQYEEPVTESHLKLANKAWAAFRASSPEKWCALLDTDTTVLPFLEGAVVRLLEEYPGCINYLSRTAEQALRVLASGEKSPGKVFAGNQQLEQRIFSGDASFWVVLQELLTSDPPLIILSQGKELALPPSKDQKLTLTPAGADVLAGKRSWLEVSDINRWIGGVYLKSDNIWCWNSNAGSIEKR